MIKYKKNLLKNKFFLIFTVFFIILAYLNFQNNESSQEVTPALIKYICGDISDNFKNNIDQEMNPEDGFQLRNLYDIEGNVVSVSSTYECNIYTDGGWVYYDTGERIKLPTDIKTSSFDLNLFQISLLLWLILFPLIFYTLRMII
jgi:hypothetical protein